MISYILRLRFGVTNPVKGQKAKFSRTVVARFLKLEYKVIESLENYYFRNTLQNK